jgi:hypothetical protein
MSEMSKEDARRHRVVNLLKRIDPAGETLKQWAVRKLLDWQPGAKRIRLGRCGIGRCRSNLSMTYQLDDMGNMTHISNGELLEDAAYYCPSCGFTGSGSRPIFRRKNVMVVADDEMKAAQAYIDAIRNRKVTGDKKFFDYHNDDRRK